MEPIKRTIEIKKLNEEIYIRWLDIINLPGVVSGEVFFSCFEIISIQLTGIDPTDVVLNIRMIKNGPVLKPKKIYLWDYGAEFVTRVGYLEFYPYNKKAFTFDQLSGSDLCELWLSTNNPEIKDPDLKCILNILLIPAIDKKTIHNSKK